MRKTTLLISALFFVVLSLGLVSASHSNQDFFETWSFSEDISGENRGFSFAYKTSLPEFREKCDYHDWSSNGRNCKRTLSFTNPGYNKLRSYDSARYRYNADQALNQVIRTFGRDSQLQLQNERAKERERNRNRYSNFGYGYGYPYYGSGFYGYRSYW